MPVKLCRTRGCRQLATYRGRCRDCAAKNERATHSNKAIYNSRRWRVLRKRVLFEQPLCEAPVDGGVCGEIATDVDHKTPIEEGGDPWSRANVQALCHPCHSKKTNGELRRR